MQRCTIIHTAEYNFRHYHSFGCCTERELGLLVYETVARWRMVFTSVFENPRVDFRQMSEWSSISLIMLLLSR